MVATSGQMEYEELEICLLKKWLPLISREYRSYIKGASKALLYAQEIQGVSLCSENAGFEKQTVVNSR